jgi:hypothetical protein
MDCAHFLGAVFFLLGRAASPLRGLRRAIRSITFTASRFAFAVWWFRCYPSRLRLLRRRVSARFARLWYQVC